MDSTLDTKNGLLNLSDPSYKLVGNNNENDKELDSDDGSVDFDDECLYEQIETSSPVCHLNRKPSVRNRRNYAQLNIGSMGVVLNPDSLANLDTPLLENNTCTTGDNFSTTDSNLEIINDKHKLLASSPVPDADNNLSTETSESLLLESVNDNDNSVNMVRRKVNKYTGSSENDTNDLHSQDTKTRDEMCRSLMDMSMTPDSCCSSASTSIAVAPDGIPHIPGQMNNDLYAIPVKCKQFPGDSDRKVTVKSPVSNDEPSPTNLISRNRDYSYRSPQPSLDLSSLTSDASEDEVLPHGWEKHEDINGPYFWHIKSGTIQRDPPKLSSSVSQQDVRHLPPPPPPLPAPIHNHHSVNTPKSPVTSSNNFVTLDDMVKKRHSCPPSSATIQTDNKGNKLIRFAIRSLGWVEIAEDDLTPDRSSKAVNRCIVDLSHGKNDKLDAIGRWGDGKDLFMDLDDHSLKLVSPIDMTVLNTQPIHTIRVWGVGRDNGRDFAYVARDRMTRKHMCHVFRCDTPARTIANTLRDICKKIMIERSLAQNLARSVNTGQVKNHPNPDSKLISVHRSHPSGNGRPDSVPMRPNNLPVEQRISEPRSLFSASHSFPTPMEEPKKVLKAHYLGSEIVKKPTGMDVLNDAIDKRMASVSPDKWDYVNVAVAPSTITIQKTGENGKCLAECRVRFLSFLGIGKDIKFCAFIMHTAQAEFVAYVFHCEPSSGAICKTIEAACKLRYQKCLDSHHPQCQDRNYSENENKSIGSTLKNMLGSLTGKKSKSMES